MACCSAEQTGRKAPRRRQIDTIAPMPVGHGGTVDGNTLSIVYNYEDGATNGEAKYVRLANVTYPNGSRVVYYNYPASGVGAALSRLDNIAADSGGNTKYAQYSYLGTGTVTKVAHPAVTGGLNLTYDITNANPAGISGDMILISLTTMGMCMMYPDIRAFVRLPRNW